MNNPTLLIDKTICEYADIDVNSWTSLDAVFVPFRSRSSYVLELLDEFEWFKGPIYLMPSDQSDVASLRGSAMYGRTTTLMMDDPEFKKLYRSLLTSRHRLTSTYTVLWDLPEKRNFALLYARKQGYKRILFIDDDIRCITQRCISRGVCLLDSYKISGCFVTEFPDTSVQGHLERVAGRTIFPFLSGSFLFIRPEHVQSFFPCIYNEDWLFMLPHVIERSICSYGNIRQVPYDPFCDINKVTFQEFGEIIVEGLYELHKTGNYDYRYRFDIWQSLINERLESLMELSLILNSQKYGPLLDAMVQANADISPHDCTDFVAGWEADITMWNEYLKETGR